MEARIERSDADLRGHLVVLLILTAAITLRTMFIAGSSAPRGPVDIPIAYELQPSISHQALSH